jgi:hypothetical protein
MFEDLKLPEKPAHCPLIRRANELEETDYKILLDTLADPRWEAPTLAKELTRRGFEVTKHQIHNHRSRRCTCVS